MGDKVKLSLTMIVKNESRCIVPCLKAVLPYVDMVVICDTGSTDGTLEMCKTWEDRRFFHVFSIPWEQDFAKARNKSLELAESLGATAHLVLDADEEFAGEIEKGMEENIDREYLEKTFKTVREKNFSVGYKRGDSAISTNSFIKNLLQLVSKQYGKSWLCGFSERNFFYDQNGRIEVAVSESQRILSKGLRFEGRIHELVDFQGPRIHLPLTFLHDGYLQMGKGKRNLNILEEELKQNKKDPYIHFQLAMTLKNEKKEEKALYHFQKFIEYISEKEVQSPYGRAGIINYFYLLISLDREELYQDAMDLIYTLEQSEAGKNIGQVADYHFVLGLFYMKYIAKDSANRLFLLPEIEKEFIHCLSIGEENRKEGKVGTGSFKAHYNLGLFYEFIGEKEKARTEFEKAASYSFYPAEEALAELDKKENKLSGNMEKNSK